MDMYDIILAKLKESREYTLDELSNNDLSKVDEVKEKLLSILNAEISSMSFSNQINDYNYLYKIFKYINIPNNNEEKITVLNGLDKIELLCEIRLQEAKNSKKNKNKNKHIIKVLNKLKEFIKINRVYIEHYNFNSKEDKEKIKYDLLNYLVYELKRYDYLKEYIKVFPNEITIRNTNGKYFIEEFLDKYFTEVILDNISNTLFYEKVIKLFIDYLTENKHEKLLNMLNNRLKLYKSEVSSASLEQNEKQRIIFYINEITNYLDNYDYDNINLLVSVNELINGIEQIDINDNDKLYLLSYFKYLSDILTNNIYGMNEIVKLNKYGIDIDNSKIEENYKEKVILLNNHVVKYITGLNFKYKDTRYLDYKYDIETLNIDELAIESKKIVIDNGEALLDCRDKYIITIDSKRTRVYDDALSIESYKDGKKLVGIYLADAVSFVKRGSPLDLYALNLGESVQLYKRYIPMLSYDIVDKLTLCENEDRRAIGYFFLLDENMNIINYEVKKCIIRVTENLNYDLANSYLTNSRNTEEIKKLKDMHLISKNMFYKETPGKEYRAMKELKKTGTSNNTTSLSNDMIVNYMVFLNSFIAKFFYSHNNIPFIYRNNMTGSDSSVRDRILEITKWDYDYFDVINCMERVTLSSYYSTINKGHSGLGVDMYCHATNPLRKYSSLEIQRLTEKYMINKDMTVDLNELERLNILCEQLNLRLDLNREYNDELITLNAKKKALTK